MKDAHLTLRLPDELARALARLAREQGHAKSHVVREAVARYVTSRAAPPAARIVRARDVAKAWSEMPRLTAAEATEYSKDLSRARKALAPPKSAWE